jgi:hypothetical protein
MRMELLHNISSVKLVIALPLRKILPYVMKLLLLNKMWLIGSRITGPAY